jgi:hypothetical protein
VNTFVISSRRIFALTLATLVLSVAWPAPGSASEGEAFLEQEVRPLLIKECLDCHGAKKQESGLRLDLRESLVKGGTSGAAVIPESPEQSLLLKAIRHEGDIHMPPDKKLKEAQIAVLERWVKLGVPMPKAAASESLRSGEITAEERQHWAFQPVRVPPLPVVKDASWVKNDVDRFILAKLDAVGIKPPIRADKRTLIRRAMLDLVGLPPTYEEVEAFLADESPDSYAKLVDRLLASPQYGERWGRHWLDVVRYADTAGDGADYPIREAYKYRNYVIDAFNADMPYDQFVREQIAGDILAKQHPEQSDARYAEQLIATGYLAMTKRFGYNINNEFQHLDLADTIDVVGRSLLGLSLGCARCHDHKYEPVTAKDYYALYGIFASSQFSFPGGEEYKRPHNLLPLTTPQKLAELQQLQQAEQATYEATLKELEAQRAALYNSFHFAGGVDFGFELQNLDQAPGVPWFTAGPNKVLAEAQSPYSLVHPAGSRGLRIGAGGSPNDGIRYQFPPRKADKSPRLYFNLDFRTARSDQPGAYRLFLGHGAIISTAVECSVTPESFSIRNGEAFQKLADLVPDAWYNVQLELDLQAKQVSGRVGQPGKYAEFAKIPFAANWDGTLDTFFSDNLGDKAGASLGRDFDNLALVEEPLGQAKVKEDKPTERITLDDFRQKLQHIDAELLRMKQQREQAVTKPWEEAYGVTEGKPMNARLQKRGEPNRLGDEVPRRFLEVLGGDTLPADATGSGRLQLAEWITRPSNPLTARVMVNRVWQGHFQRGLVATPSDFGIRGERPSHPELLDYLTSRFVAEGWSLKKLHRWIMLSNTYQASSENRPESAAIDPENKLFWRQRRHGLDAETLRDSMLLASGLLDSSPGAGHPFPPVAQWGFTIHYPFQAVYETRRRSVYLMVQRSRRHPFLTLFDGSDPNISTAVRDTTITPTQALFLMNSPFVHEQAAALAAQLEQEQDGGARLILAYKKTLSRAPMEAEVQDARAFLHSYRERLAGQTNAEASAWAALVRVLLTSNEFLYVD